MIGQVCKLELKYNDILYNASLTLCEILEEEQGLIEHCLTPEEKQGLALLHLSKRRKEFLFGRIAAKQALLALYPGLGNQSFSIINGILGQPLVMTAEVQGAAPQVSISHVNNLAAALAFTAEAPMGLDVEHIRVERINAIKSCLTEVEIQLCTSANIPDNAFFAVWAAKEALSKVLKTGMSTPFVLYEVKNLKQMDGFFQGEFVNFPQYNFTAFLYGNFILSIVMPKLILFPPAEMKKFLCLMPLKYPSSQCDQD